MSRKLPDLLIEPVVRRALAEDLGRAGDVTAAACIPEGARMKAAFVARKPGVLAGIDAVLVELPDLPETWQVYGARPAAEALERIGLVRRDEAALV